MDFVESMVESLIEASLKAGKPISGFHSCRMAAPTFPNYAYGKCDQKHDGKCLDVVYGIKKKGAKGKSEVQAIRYDSTKWTEASARAHCKYRGGVFTVASKEKK